MDVRHSDLVGGRLDFAYLCNDRGYKVVAEVGTDRGVFARGFLERWKGDMFYCVDSYCTYSDMPWNREPDYLTAIRLLAPYASKTRILKCSSHDATICLKLAGIVLDFAYIDAAHDYASVNNDLTLWWPLIRNGGILAGDDFDTEHDGVMHAVTDFAESHRLAIQLTTDYNRPPSWFIEKV